MKAILLLISVLLYCINTFAQSTPCSNVIKEDTVLFSKKSVFLNWVAKKKLYHLAMELNKNPGCKIVVTGYGNNCITCQQTSWDRVYSVIQYIRHWEVDSTRFVFSAAQHGDNSLMVSIKSLLPGEEGPAMIEPYIPCYSYHRLTKKRCKGTH